MPCADCGKEFPFEELVQCDVCGKRCCPECFAMWHDGVTLPLGFADFVETL